VTRARAPARTHARSHARAHARSHVRTHTHTECTPRTCTDTTTTHTHTHPRAHTHATCAAVSRVSTIACSSPAPPPPGRRRRRRRRRHRNGEEDRYIGDRARALVSARDIYRTRLGAGPPRCSPHPRRRRIAFHPLWHEPNHQLWCHGYRRTGTAGTGARVSEYGARAGVNGGCRAERVPAWRLYSVWRLGGRCILYIGRTGDWVPPGVCE
jgi:hypothetical protein